MIEDVCTERMMVYVRNKIDLNKEYIKPISVIRYTEYGKFLAFLMKYKDFIAKRQNPHDRWEPFEARVNGVYNYDQHERVIKSRLRPGESLN